MIDGEPAEGSSGSYYSAIVVSEKTPDVERPPGLDDVKEERPSGRGKGIGGQKSSKRDLTVVASKQKPKENVGRVFKEGGGFTGIPAKKVGEGGDKQKTLVGKEQMGEVSSETLRSIDLSPLPQCASSLNFGDWLVIVVPMMGDISYSIGVWWNLVMEGVQKSYETWLREDPLGRLKVQVEIDPQVSLWPRTEKRAFKHCLKNSDWTSCHRVG